MAPLPSLPAAFLRRAAADPEEPWLFHTEGWDWIWHPWKELAGWLERWRAALSSLPPGSRAAFQYDARPESVILDLAIQAAGLVSAPNGGKKDAVWIERRGLEIEISPSGHLFHDGSGAVVRIGGEDVVWTAAEIVAAGERLQGVIGEAGKREIVVLGGPLEDPLERSMMAWATLSGAAVVLEPDPALRTATAAWVRPTVFHGTPEEIADLRSRAGKARKGRLPFRRLWMVLVSGEISGEEAGGWRERGVKVFPVGWPSSPQPSSPGLPPT
ncbi:MAG TPA: hypothetical protein VGP73_15830 [Thermoanaerobaculia bacterium]